MELYSKTDIGKIRTVNQDTSNGSIMSDSMAWAVVCDGMGGTSGGDVASRMAADKIANILNENLKKDMNQQEIKYIIQNAVKNANSIIFDAAQMNENFKKMGTTVVLCVIYSGVLHTLHAGDSRAYVLSESGIKQITKDHSIVQDMVDSGEITQELARNHPQKNIITRAVGIREEVNPEYQQISLEEGTLVMLCTDGITSYLNEEEIYQICSSNGLKESVEILINEANNRGGADNITVSILKV